MSDTRCFLLEVDGQQVLVHGDPDMPPEARQALAEIVRAAVAMAGDTPSGGERP